MTRFLYLITSIYFPGKKILLDWLTCIDIPSSSSLLRSWKIVSFKSGGNNKSSAFSLPPSSLSLVSCKNVIKFPSYTSNLIALRQFLAAGCALVLSDFSP